MMKTIIRAEHLGFCFGVKRAIELARKTAKNSKTQVYSLGHLIHNEAVTAELEKDGIKVIDKLTEIEAGSVVIVRSHGVGEDVYDEARAANLEVVDATCPFVSRIHKLVKEAYLTGKRVVIAGNAEHPEVKGINGWCNNSAIIISDASELKAVDFDGKNTFLVAQTTLKQKTFNEIKEKLQTLSPDLEVENTICYVTEERQRSAERLSQKVDVMLVIGGQNSSNSQKLYEIAKKNCEKAYFVENKQKLPLQEIQFYNTIGVVAGASTPEHLIEEVIANMSEIITENTQMNPMDEYMDEIAKSSKLPKSGETVEGIVIGVNDKQVIVNISCKKDAIIPKEEMSMEDTGDLTELFKVGDTIRARVVKHNDGDGNILLSRRKMEAEKYWQELKTAEEEHASVEVKVTREVRAGVLATYKEITGFIPFSGLSNKFIEGAGDFVGKTLRVKILKLDLKRGRVILSHRGYLYELRQKALDEIWGALSVGDIVEGTVMRFTDYGAFVDIGGIDGLLHISEISWGKLTHPDQVLKLGQKIPVKILSMNREQAKISLGYKQTQPEPWTKVEGNYEVGQKIKGIVVQIKEYGAFVQIEPGLDGLIHISEIADRRIENVGDELKVKQEVEALIIGIDNDKKRISLSLKALIGKDSDKKDDENESEEVKEPIAEETEKPEKQETVQAEAQDAATTESAESAESAEQTEAQDDAKPAEQAEADDAGEQEEQTKEPESSDAE